MNTYMVNGTIDGVYVSLTVQATSVTDAVNRAKTDEPNFIVTHVNRVSVGDTSNA